MAILRCPNGHYYDNQKYKECPVCLQGTLIEEDEKTIPVYAVVEEWERTVPYTLLNQDVIAQPVVGWLVCLKGQERGRDWRITSGRNFAGNTPDSDIMIAESAEKAENMFSIIYDGRHRSFMVAPGAVSTVYLNGKLLSRPKELNDDDEITVGEMVLCFRSFCRGEQRCWE